MLKVTVIVPPPPGTTNGAEGNRSEKYAMLPALLVRYQPYTESPASNVKSTGAYSANAASIEGPTVHEEPVRVIGA